MLKQKTFISNFLLLFLFISAVFISLFQTFNQILQGDENEHLYGAYMVFLGNVPYRDFFEHHNPLLWYITAPLYFFLENNEKIYYATRFIMFLCIILTAFYIYKISKILNIEKFFCFLAPILYLGFDVNLLTGIQFRPDTPMTLFFVTSLFYLIKYTKYKKWNDLNLSIISITISFWFLQKALILYIPIAFLLFYKILKKEILLKDILSASFFSVLISTFYILYLYKNNTLNLYYEYNFIGNIYIKPTLLCEINLQNNISLLLMFIINILASILFYKQKTIIFLSLSNLTMEMLTLYFLPAHSIHYLLPLLPITSILYVIIFQKILLYQPLKIFIVLVIFIYQIINFSILKKENYYPLSNTIKINKFIVQNTTKDEEILTNTEITGIKKQAKGYYYFGPQNTIKLINKIFPYKKLISDEEVIINKKPKILYLDQYISENLQTYIYNNYKPVKLYDPSIVFYIKK